MEIFEYITNHLSKEERKVYGKYDLPKSKREKFKLDERDKETFLKLVRVCPNQSYGDGEIAFAWLWNYNRSGNLKDNLIAENINDGKSSADFIINGCPVEIKSYKTHSATIGLGKFKSDFLSRHLLSYIFGIRKIGQDVFDDHIADAQHFRFSDVLNGFRAYKKYKDFLYNESNETYAQNLFAVSEEFDRVMKSIDENFDYRDPEICAAILVRNMIGTKFLSKPGNGGYMVNICKKNPLDIMFHKIDIANLPYTGELYEKGFYVNSSEINVKLDTIFGE